MKLLPFFSLLSDCHSSLFCKESVILVFYSRLPQSYDQNTKLDKTLCSRVGSEKKRKYQFTFPSFSPFFFLFKKCSRRLLKSGDRNRFQGQRFLVWKDKRFNVFSTILWAKQKVILISLTSRDYQLQFLVSSLRPIKLSTLFSHELLAFISVCCHFWSHHPNKGCLLLKGLPAKKLNL